MRFVVCMLISVFFLSCKTLSNRLSKAKLDCGAEAVDPSKVYFRVLDENSEGLALTRELGLFARYRDELGTLSRTDARSSKGCLVLPAGARDVEVVAPGIQQGLLLTDQAAERVLSLKKIPRLSAEAACSPEGDLVRDTLAVNWSFSQNFDLEMYGLRFLAVGAGGEMKVLFEKKRGEGKLDLPREWDLKGLGNGAFHLQLWMNDPLSGTDMVHTGRDCDFVRRASPPLLEGLPEGPEDRIYKVGEILPWKTSVEKGQLFVCSEAGEGGGCVPRTSCQDPRNFEPVPFVTIKQGGLHRIFIFARDELGNQSEVACRNLAFMDQKARLQIRWAKDSWNQPLARMETPYADLGARIDISHAQLPAQVFEKGLECKAELQLVDKEKDKSIQDQILCVSGRCSGKILKDWIPCDPDLQLSLRNAGDSRLTGSGKYLLFVRTKDGEGSYSEGQAELRFDARLRAEEPSYRGYFFADGKEVVRDLAGDGAELFQDPRNRELYRFVYRWDDALKEAVYSFDKRKEGAWLPHAEKRMASTTGCEMLYADALQQIWCRVDKLFHMFDGKAWHDIPDVAIGSRGHMAWCTEIKDSEQFVTRDAAGDFFVVCDGNIYRLGGDWKADLIFTASRSELMAKALQLDSAGRVWGHFWDARTGKDSFAFVSAAGLEAIPASPMQDLSWGDSPCLSLVAGQMVFRNQRWLPEEKRWEALPFFLSEESFFPLARVMGRPKARAIWVPRNLRTELGSSQVLFKDGRAHDRMRSQALEEFSRADSELIEAGVALEFLREKRRRRIEEIPEIADESLRVGSPLAKIGKLPYAFYRSSVGNILAAGKNSWQRSFIFRAAEMNWRESSTAVANSSFLYEYEGEAGSFWGYDGLKATNYTDAAGVVFEMPEGRARETRKLGIFPIGDDVYFLFANGWIGRAPRTGAAVQEIDYAAAGFPDEVKEGLTVLPESLSDRPFLRLRSGSLLLWDLTAGTQLRFEAPVAGATLRCPLELADKSLYLLVGPDLYRKREANWTKIAAISADENCFSIDSAGYVWMKDQGRFFRLDPEG